MCVLYFCFAGAGCPHGRAGDHWVQLRCHLVPGRTMSCSKATQPQPTMSGAHLQQLLDPQFAYGPLALNEKIKFHTIPLSPPRSWFFLSDGTQAPSKPRAALSHLAAQDLRLDPFCRLCTRKLDSNFHVKHLADAGVAAGCHSISHPNHKPSGFENARW